MSFTETSPEPDHNYIIAPWFISSERDDCRRSRPISCRSSVLWWLVIIYRRQRSRNHRDLFSPEVLEVLADAARVLGLMDSARIVCSPSCLYYGNRRRIIDRDRRYSGRSCFSPGSFKSAASGCMLRDDNRLTLDVRFDEHSSIYWKRSAPRSRGKRGNGWSRTIPRSIDSFT